MSNVEIHIVVEGPTEQTFVREVLAPEVAIKGIYCRAVRIGKPGHKGGDVRFARAQVDIGNFLKQRPDIYVSTMFDYFRIGGDWPGLTELRQKISEGTSFSASQKAEFLEEATLLEIEKLFPQCNVKARFIPYLAMHEFEALLFSNVDILGENLNISVDKISELIDEYEGPEEINDDPLKAPSKQLEALKSDYRKIVMGKMISEQTGIQAIRDKCPHFNDWLTRLENITYVKENN